MEISNWTEQLVDIDLVIWKPSNMGLESSTYFKEKIYFMASDFKVEIILKLFSKFSKSNIH